MGEFFHGWKRKAGLLLLAISCALAAWWMRSLRMNDTILVHSKACTVQVRSHLGRIQCNWRWEDIPVYYPNWAAPTWRSKPLGEYEIGYAQFHPAPMFGEYIRWTDGHGTNHTFTMLHRTVVVPLTLLSAWLLMSRRKSKRTTHA